jgi:RNase P/RNase MRP subunit p29
MKSLLYVLALAATLQLAGLSTSAAEAAKTYQVTGPVLEVTEKAIVVQKGDERWEIARDEKTRIDGELKVGNKVTIHYRMLAVSVDSKAEGKKKSK